MADYGSHTLFLRSECLEVLGLVDLESLRKRPRHTVGVTVKASVVLPESRIVDWTTHYPEQEGEEVGD
uniref:Uncharacterized protein n=1 Tax=Setaria viridis TaxID=4556 RepID=A0A4U6UX28_SETVI|nr:hypothetical protein SEVIR_4G172900v2 [Setaria viridis]